MRKLADLASAHNRFHTSEPTQAPKQSTVATLERLGINLPKG